MRITVLAVAVALLCGGLPTAASGACNPAIDRLGLADPFVLVHDGVYYLYPTVDGVEGYQVWTSTDAETWTEGPVVFNAGPDAWAPELYYDDESETFYLYYSVNFDVGIATASSPLGPFVDQGVLVTDAIDAHLFEDDGGSLYLYYEEILFTGPVPTTSHLWVQPMSTPSTPSGPPTPLFGPTDDWEVGLLGGITEGPFMLKHGDTYYLMYSGHLAPTLNYAIGYATSDSPTGPFTKYTGNPIASKAENVIGPGHHSLFRAPNGRLMVAYHQKRTRSFGFDRYIAIDPLIIRPDGTLDIEPRPLVFEPGAVCEAEYDKRGERGRLTVRSKGGAKDKLSSVITRIPEIFAADLGDPTVATAYSIYIESLGVIALPPSDRFRIRGDIGRETLVYKDKSGSAGGITLLEIRTGSGGRAKLVIEGKGRNLGLVPPLNFAEPQEVSVCNDLGVCISSSLDRTLKSTDTAFKGKRSGSSD